VNERAIGLKEFGQTLGQLRAAAGLTQEQLAEQIDVSSFQLISKWERGLKKPGRQKLLRLIESLVDQLADPETARRWALQAGYELTVAELSPVFPAYAAPPSQPLTYKPQQQPPLPDFYTNRPDLERQLLNFLVPDSPRQTLVLCGPGGAGKSTLAAWAASEVGDQFPDGVLWLECDPGFGQNSDSAREVVNLQEQIARSFQVVLSRGTPAERAGELRSLLRGKRCLLVLDNMWGHPDLRQLKVHNPTCPMLITTRDRSVAHSFEAVSVVEVAGLSEIESRNLLRKLLLVPDPDNALNELIHRLAYWPLALTLAGALLQVGYEPAELLDALGQDAAGLDALALGEAQDRQASLSRCFDVSYHRLTSDALRQFFSQTGCFQGAFEPEAAIRISGTSLSQPRQALRELVRYNLLIYDGQRYRLHGLLRDYARQKLRTDWAEVEARTGRRYVAYFSHSALCHPQVAAATGAEAPQLEDSWADVVAGVRWAALKAPDLAAGAVVLAHTERPALLEAVGSPLIEAVEVYLNALSHVAEKALLTELGGDLYALVGDYETARCRFEQASELWLAAGEGLAASRAKLRVGGLCLVREEQQSAVTAASRARDLLNQNLPVRADDLPAADRLFYWFDVLYSVLVKWPAFPEQEVAALAELAQKTGQPSLEARGWHIYRLWCTAANRLEDDSVRLKARRFALHAALLWRRCGQKDKAQAEVMWTQEHIRGHRLPQLAKAFARRRSQMTPAFSPDQIKLVKSERLRQWLRIGEEQRIRWLVQNLPAPGNEDWSSLDDILEIGIRGRDVRRFVPGQPRPEGHLLSEPMWRVFTAQKTFPLAVHAVRELIKRYVARLAAELSA
jgi:transcriptional regulator with XRE-family HTH domain